MREVASEEVALYRNLVTKLALRYRGRGGAELDDLEQEGLIAVWRSLRSGAEPSNTAIKNSMVDWVRKLYRQKYGG